MGVSGYKQCYCQLPLCRKMRPHLLKYGFGLVTLNPNVKEKQRKKNDFISKKWFEHILSLNPSSNIRETYTSGKSIALSIMHFPSIMRQSTTTGARDMRRLLLDPIDTKSQFYFTDNILDGLSVAVPCLSIKESISEFEYYDTIHRLVHPVEYSVSLQTPMLNQIKNTYMGFKEDVTKYNYYNSSTVPNPPNENTTIKESVHYMDPEQAIEEEIDEEYILPPLTETPHQSRLRLKKRQLDNAAPRNWATKYMIAIAEECPISGQPTPAITSKFVQSNSTMHKNVPSSINPSIIVPLAFFSTEAKKDDDNELGRKRKKAINLQDRFKHVIDGAFMGEMKSTQGKRKKKGVTYPSIRFRGWEDEGNTSRPGGIALQLDWNTNIATIRDVLIPLHKVNEASYKHTLMMGPHEHIQLFYNNKSVLSNDLLKATMNQGKHVVYIDSTNILGNGEFMAYCRVRHYCSDDMIRSCKDLSSTSTNKKRYLVFFLMVQCHVLCNANRTLHNIEKERRLGNELYLKHTDEVQDLLAFTARFLQALQFAYNKNLEYIFGQSSDEGLLLSVADFDQLGWLFWSPHCLKLLPYHSHKEIQRRLNIIHSTVLKVMPDCPPLTMTSVYQLPDHVKKHIENVMLHDYEVIMGLSSHSQDNQTMLRFQRVTEDLHNPWSFSDLFDFMELGEVYEGIVELYRNDSFQSIRALFTVYSNISSLVSNNGGIFLDDNLFGLIHVNEKKKRIIQNSLLEFEENAKFCGVG